MVFEKCLYGCVCVCVCVCVWPVAHGYLMHIRISRIIHTITGLAQKPCEIELEPPSSRNCDYVKQARRAVKSLDEYMRKRAIKIFATTTT